MGASGSGKTSMRSLIFANNPASMTARLGATIDVEQNHVRFLGDLILNLWDCGGQDAFMDSYLSTQQSTIFQHVGALIYVVEVESRNLSKDLEYYAECLNSLRRYSPEASVFVLVHKMDLVRAPRAEVLEKRVKDLRAASGDTPITVFGTSIYDETLYKAWSQIVRTLIPNASVLSKHLTILADACSATEVILFERTTFLVIATSEPPTISTAPAPIAPPTIPPTPSGSTKGKSPSSSSDEYDFSMNSNGQTGEEVDEHGLQDPHKMHASRYERTSELIKSFKHSCSRSREDFHALEMELPEFTAVLDELTKNTYVLIIVHDPTIGTSSLILR